MPELPEMETIKIGLQKRIIGLKIQKIQIISPKSFKGNPNLAQGQKITGIWRRAKLLGVDLAGSAGSMSRRASSLANRSLRLRVGMPFSPSPAYTLLFHLKMSGQLIWVGQVSSIKGQGEDKLIGGHPTEDMSGKMPNSHTRVIFTFVGQGSSIKGQGKQKSGLKTIATSHLYFNDQRRFGWVKVMGQGSSVMGQALKELGPEPLEKEFSWQVLKKNLLRHKKTPVKVAIMDQTTLAGVGNIYSNEACFYAKLDPRTKIDDLSDKQFKDLYGAIIKALKEGIKHGGSTRAHFVDAEGHRGYFLDYAFVYGRDKHPCKVCGSEIKKITLGGRGTYYCPNCQKLPKK